MIFRLFRRDPRAATIAALYGAIVAQARAPGFYLEYGVPDTPEGRFDMIGCSEKDAQARRGVLRAPRRL